MLFYLWRNFVSMGLTGVGVICISGANGWCVDCRQGGRLQGGVDTDGSGATGVVRYCELGLKPGAGWVLVKLV